MVSRRLPPRRRKGHIDKVASDADRYRGLSAEERLDILDKLNRYARELFEVGYRMRHPGADGREIAEAYYRASRIHRRTAARG